MRRDIADYVRKYDTCQQVKFEHRKPGGLLKPLDILEWKWDNISIDFVEGLPLTKRNHNSIWVIMDRLTKVGHFIPTRNDLSVEELGQIYIDQVFRYHGAPSEIVSDRGPQFTSHLWRSMQRALGTKQAMSTAYHPQTERLNQTMEDMLRACVLNFKCSRDEHLPLMEFYYKNSYQASIGM